MLLYSYKALRDKAVIDCINDGLRQGKLVVYASINADSRSHISKISSGITDYKEHLDRGDLLILDIRELYNAALNGVLGPFGDLKVVLEQAARERKADRKRDEVVVVADCAENLSKYRRFATCFDVENWWQNTHFEWIENKLRITVVCPHPRLQANLAQYQRLISHLHSETITVLEN